MSFTVKHCVLCHGLEDVKVALQKEKNSGRNAGSASYGSCGNHTKEEEQAGAKAINEMTQEILGLKSVQMLKAGTSFPGS